MSTANKYMQSASGVGGVLNVEDVFSTYLYTGNSTARSISNGIDLSGEGGLTWIKSRSSTREHSLYDTERGVEKLLKTNSTGAEQNTSGGLTSFNSDGFSLGTYADINGTSYGDFASWTFRKAPNFFDVVTYTGDGTVGRNISHNLGSKPGCVIVKKTSGSEGWFVSHRGYNSGLNTGYLNMTNAFTAGTSTEIPVYYATDTTFRVSNISGQSYANTNGATYVAYLFAHNDGDGGFGPDGDKDIIKCGSYTGNTTVNLGFEPQWILAKRIDSSTYGDWFISDVMRGWTVNTSGYPRERFLNANQSWQEALDSGGTNSYSNSLSWLPTSTGFKVFGFPFQSSGSYVYIAIRRPTAVPESATEVFDVGDASETGSTAPEYEGGFVVDMAIKRIMSASQPNYVFDRLRGGNALASNLANSESAFGAAKFDYMNGYYNGTSTSSTNWSAMWKRAPKYFDVVAYTGNGTVGRTVSHNLGVAPEMMWVKRRSSSNSWAVYHSGLDVDGDGLPETDDINLNSSAAATDQVLSWNDTAPTATHFTVGNGNEVNNSSGTYIAYLFASLDGISKVGSYTGSASEQTIDCGFTAGARFVLIKRTDSTGSWVVWDTNRGIVAGNDPYFILESNTAPTTTDDYIDPHNSGFTIAGSIGFINTSGGSYIFYAIA